MPITLRLLLLACSRSASYVVELCLLVHICPCIAKDGVYVAAAIYCVPKPEGVCGCLQALTRLCEQTECDVRSCLNTLQFLARKGRPIKVADLAGLSIGQKDISKGAFAIWQDLLQIKVCKAASTSTIVSVLPLHCCRCHLAFDFPNHVWVLQYILCNQ